MSIVSCAHCGTAFVPTVAQRRSQARGLRLFCTPRHAVQAGKTRHYDPDGLYADWDGSQLWCCGRFHPVTAIPLQVPCCGHVWLAERVRT